MTLDDAVIGDPADVGLVALTADHLPDIAALLREPEVARCFGPFEEELAAIAGHIGEPQVWPFAVMAEGAFAGYLQAYHANAEPFWRAFGVPAETCGIDLSLRVRGRGLGPRAIALVAARLWALPGVVRVQTDPDPANARSVRAFEKAGFVAHSEAPGYDGGRMLYMTARSPDGQ